MELMTKENQGVIWDGKWKATHLGGKWLSGGSHPFKIEIDKAIEGLINEPYSWHIEGEDLIIKLNEDPIRRVRVGEKVAMGLHD